ncbi:hypothetical protein [Sporichthya polymorpha]|uniref:hypothetical protein n=1 Tax=Sporichthya polymorpha TaxID=35751 RepID=UPI00035D1E5D|nr:hypothetical protein [Sporichthya polymorpha]
MTLPIRSLAAHATAVTLLCAAATVAFAPAAGAAEDRPLDQVAAAVAQVIYPDAEGMESDWTARERIDGWLGYNSFPGGPLGQWGPGPEGVGYYGTVGALIGGPPLPGYRDEWGAQRGPGGDGVAAVDELVFGPSEDYTGSEDAVYFPGSDPTQPPGPGSINAGVAPIGSAE